MMERKSRSSTHQSEPVIRRLHWHIFFIAHFLLRRKFVSMNGHFSTHFPRREKLIRQLFHSKKNASPSKRVAKKMCGAFTLANKTCRIDAENMWRKCAAVWKKRNGAHGPLHSHLRFRPLRLRLGSIVLGSGSSSPSSSCSSPSSS